MFDEDRTFQIRNNTSGWHVHIPKENMKDNLNWFIKKTSKVVFFDKFP